MFKKYAFFDVDGVLSAPRFIDHNSEFVIGFDEAGWKNYLNTYNEDAYQYCDSIPQIDKYLYSLYEENVELYVLSAISQENEISAKKKYLDRKYPGVFKEYYFVYSSSEKVPLIEDFCKQRNINTNQCMLIEDTFDILLEAHNHDIVSIHISNILSDTISK